MQPSEIIANAILVMMYEAEFDDVVLAADVVIKELELFGFVIVKKEGERGI